MSLKQDQSATLVQMIKSINNAPKIYQPSKYWDMWIDKNLMELKTFGLKNFKQYQALNYFTFFKTLKKEDNNQFQFLLKHTGWLTKIKCLVTPVNLTGFGRTDMSDEHKRFYQIFVRLLWEYTSRHDPEKLLKRLKEPKFGQPFPVYWHGQLISQDLANSVLEYYSIRQAITRLPETATILEIGGGYGRTAYVFLSLSPKIRYIMVDIPPALYIAQKYLTHVFPDRPAFLFRNFSSFKGVEKKLQAAQLIFLTPPQLELLPDKSVDIALNISSFQEMRREQINNYFQQIDRLISGIFYFKQWHSNYIPFEEITITEDDYPIPKYWQKLYHRVAAVQTKFFEAAYAIK